MPWIELSTLAPHTKATWEKAAVERSVPILEAIPDYLGLQPTDRNSPEWATALGTQTSLGLTGREVLLRYLITRAVVDQGSDIEGVEMWHSGFMERCYAAGIPIIHDPKSALDSYETVLKIADEERRHVFEKRAAIWASGGSRRSVLSYNVFSVEGLRGKGMAHWFVSSRVFPTLMLALARPGGLEDIVFGDSANELPVDMSRRLRNDLVEGLGHTIGDKACDLFTKWAIGSYRLSSGVQSCPWQPSDCPIPMDQRIGRMMIRCGFMDEFFGVSKMMTTQAIFRSRPEGSNRTRPTEYGDPLPDGIWHLTVMNFRRKAKVTNPLMVKWCRSEWKHQGLTGTMPRLSPQNVVSLLCRSLNTASGTQLTPVELDDFFMHVAADSESLSNDGAMLTLDAYGTCHDESPDCGRCVLGSACQAENDPSAVNLKDYIT